MVSLSNVAFVTEGRSRFAPRQLAEIQCFAEGCIIVKNCVNL